MMRVARPLVLFALLPVFAGCQMFSSKPVDTTAGQTRLQGELVTANDQLVFQPCVVQQLYRLERNSSGCQDPNFKQLTVHANGNGPAWEVQAGGKGMVLKREGQPDLALPYVEEQVGDGRFSLSTEANNQRIELWVAPQRCTDSANGSVQHLGAELRINGQVQRGCGYFGGARND